MNNRIKKIIKETEHCRPRYIEGPRGCKGETGPTGPAGTSVSQVVNGGLYTETDAIHMDVNKVRFELQSININESQLSISPVIPGENINIDLKRFSQFDDTGIDGTNGILDDYNLTGTTIIDNIIYSSSREINKIWIRQQDPETQLWSLHEINIFISRNKSRITMWANEIFKDIEL